MPLEKSKNSPGSPTAGTIDTGKMQQNTGQLIRNHLLQKDISGNR